MLMCCFVRCDATGDHQQFIVPRSLHNEVLHHVHDSLLGGYLGQKKTREMLSKGSTGVVLERIAIIGVLNVMNVPKHSPRNPHAPLGKMPVGAPLD